MGDSLRSDRFGEPSQEHQGPFDRTEQIIQGAKARYSRFLKKKLGDWRQVIGVRVDEMLNSHADAERSIEDPNPKIREGAFTVLAYVWQPRSEFAEACKQAVLSDPDPGVKSAAILCMIRLLYDSKDRESSRLLSSIIKEESNPLRLRCAAYLGLLQIQGMNISTDLALAIHHAKNILPKEVDIALVDSFVS